MRKRSPGVFTSPTDARLSRIVRTLSNHPDRVISAAKLASEVGATNSEAWRLVQTLRRYGVPVEGRPAAGYRLRHIPDLLLPDFLEPLARGTIFSRNIHHYFQISSTNTAALEAAAEGAPEGSVFVAEQQTAGRGRGDHSWDSQRSSGIYCSVVLRPMLPPSEALVVSLAAGLAAQAAIRSQKVPVDLKWPNDLMIAGKKVGGILTEMAAEATRVRHIVVGIGINANQTRFPADLQTTATSLRLATGREWPRVELCAALLKSLDQEYRALTERSDARESILLRFQERSSYVKGRVIYVEENGGFEGTTYGLDERGFLRVRTPDGIRVVLSGSIRAV